MKYLRLLFICGLLLTDFKNAYAMTAADYDLLQESLTLLLAIPCLILAISILQSIRGGILMRPWVLFAVAFALLAAGSLLHLLDIKSIFVTQYDLRPGLLVVRSVAMLLIVAGLIFYKKDLQ